MHAHKIGRNEPCPCGSGRKYKQCCLLAGAEAMQPTPVRLFRQIQRELEGVLQQHASFLRSAYGENALPLAWASFIGNDDDEPLQDDPLIRFFLNWTLFDWRADDDEQWDGPEEIGKLPPMALWLKRHRTQTGSAFRQFIEAALTTPMSFHRVTAMPGDDLWELQDVLTGASRTVRHEGLDEAYDLGDIVYARIVEVQGTTLFATLSDPIGDTHAERKIRRACRWQSGLEQVDDAQVRDFEYEYRSLFLELCARGTFLAPIARNADDEPLQRIRIDYEVDDAEAALQELKTLSEDAEDIANPLCIRDGDTFTKAYVIWRRPDPERQMLDAERTLGHLLLTPGHLRVSVDSPTRAERIRELVGARLGSRARLKLAREISIEEIAREISAAETADHDESILRD